jgi:hypothetical protein
VGAAAWAALLACFAGTLSGSIVPDGSASESPIVRNVSFDTQMEAIRGEVIFAHRDVTNASINNENFLLIYKSLHNLLIIPPYGNGYYAAREYSSASFDWDGKFAFQINYLMKSLAPYFWGISKVFGHVERPDCPVMAYADGGIFTNILDNQFDANGISSFYLAYQPGVQTEPSSLASDQGLSCDICGFCRNEKLVLGFFGLPNGGFFSDFGGSLRNLVGLTDGAPLSVTDPSLSTRGKEDAKGKECVRVIYNSVDPRLLIFFTFLGMLSIGSQKGPQIGVQ